MLDLDFEHLCQDFRHHSPSWPGQEEGNALDEEPPVRNGFHSNHDEEVDRRQIKRVTACSRAVFEDAIQARVNTRLAKVTNGPGGLTVVTCFCEEEHDQGVMVYCWECKMWQHSECSLGRIRRSCWIRTSKITARSAGLGPRR